MMETYLSNLAQFPGFLLALVGAFYMFAGFVLAREVVFDSALSNAIETISMEGRESFDTHHQVWMMVSAILIFASGAALIFLSVLAVWFFGLALLQQILSLV